MVPGFNQPKALTLGKDLIPAFHEPQKVPIGDQSGPFIGSYEFLNGSHAIADDHGKDLLGDGEDASACLARKTVVEHANLERPVDEPLNHDRSGRALKVVARLASVTDPLHSKPAMANIGLQNQGKLDLLPVTESRQQRETPIEVAWREKPRLGRELRARPMKFEQGFELGFPNQAAIGNSRVGGTWQ